MADTVNAPDTGSGSGLVLEDSDIGTYCEFFNNTAQKANLQVERLIQTLNAASETAFVEGKTAEALKEYVRHLETLRGTILDYGQACCDLLKEFMEKIEKIDKLY